MIWLSMEWAKCAGIFEVEAPPRHLDAIINRVVRTDFPAEAIEVE